MSPYPHPVFISRSNLTAILRDYDAFVQRLEKLNILEAYTLKPLLDGKAVAKALSATPGPWMKDALDVIMAWQLRNPDGKSAEEAIEEVRNSGLHGELTTDLISHFLRLTIRPFFLQNQHPAVTAQGRKVTTTVLPKKIELEKSDEEAKPWKSRESYAIDLLQWVVQNLDEESIERQWPLLVPPILSITDDIDTVFKAKGCAMLEILLKSTPPALLARTGLGQVFEEAIMPCLGYLPTLTPEKESIDLLMRAYPALIALSRTASPESPPAGSRKTAKDLGSERIAFLDTVLRKGIFGAYGHCSENVKITEALMKNFCLVNTELGIESVKHLKHTLPMLSEVLSQPFGSAYPPLLIAALQALQNVIVNGWPRIATNKGELLNGLTLCWLQSDDVQGHEKLRIRQESKTVIHMLRTVDRGEGLIEEDFRMLMNADSRLEGLFDT